MENEQPHWKTNPKPVSALEYTNCIIRACTESGLMIDRSHVSTIREKLLNELKLPRIRVLQILNRLAEADLDNKETIEVSVNDIRLILQLGHTLTE